MTRKDYRVDVRVRNNNILKAVEAIGYDSIPVFCKEQSLRYEDVNNLINMTRSPLSKAGEYRQVTMDLMELLDKRFEELFDEQQMIGVMTNRAMREVKAEEIYSLMYEQKDVDLLPFDVADRSQMAEAVRGCIKGLTEKEQLVLSKRFGFDGPEQTLNEVGEYFGISGTRVQQIEAKALRKLRYPSRSDVLRDFICNDDEVGIKKVVEEKKVEKKKEEVVLPVIDKTEELSPVPPDSCKQYRSLKISLSWSEEQERLWKQSLTSRPKAIRELVDKYKLHPHRVYRIEAIAPLAIIHSLAPDGSVRMIALREINRTTKEGLMDSREVFIANPTDLQPLERLN